MESEPRGSARGRGWRTRGFSGLVIVAAVLAGLGVGAVVVRTPPVSAASATAPVMVIRLVISGFTDVLPGGAAMADSWSWGMANSGSPAPGGAGLIRLDPVVIAKSLDKSSPKLFHAAALGQHFPEVKVELCRVSCDVSEYMTITMSNAFISSYQFGGSTQGDRPTESISFNFQKMNVVFVATGEGDSFDCAEFPMCVHTA